MHYGGWKDDMDIDMGWDNDDLFDLPVPKPNIPKGYKFATNTQDLEDFEWVAAKHGINIKIGEAYGYRGQSLKGCLTAIFVPINFPTFFLYGLLWAYEALWGSCSIANNKLADENLPPSFRGEI